jgi:hypothetical protein
MTFHDNIATEPTNPVTYVLIKTTANKTGRLPTTRVVGAALVSKAAARAGNGPSHVLHELTTLGPTSPPSGRATAARPTRNGPRVDPAGSAGSLVSRRREPRYAASTLLWIQWWDSGECNGRSAELVNVSRHGAMIVSPVLLRVSQALRMFLEDLDDIDGVAASVLGAVEGKAGRHQLRLAFTQVCPDDFIAAAAHGFESWLARDRP